MTRELGAEAEALLREVEENIDSPSMRMIPRLLRLARLAPVGSGAWALAHRLLAARWVHEDPWKASLLARRALRGDPNDAAAWKILALAQSLLGHHRFAVRAYRRALALDPGDPVCAHNLGHLYDVALDRPGAALSLLLRAHHGRPSSVEIAASYAHALYRAGELERAHDVMRPLMRSPAPRYHHELYRCIVDGLSERLHRDARPPQMRRVRRRCSTGA